METYTVNEVGLAVFGMLAFATIILEKAVMPMYRIALNRKNGDNGNSGPYTSRELIRHTHEQVCEHTARLAGLETSMAQVARYQQELWDEIRDHGHRLNSVEMDRNSKGKR